MKKTASPAIDAWLSEVVKALLGKLLSSKNWVFLAAGYTRNWPALAVWRILNRMVAELTFG
jgi:hypothetical protein